MRKILIVAGLLLTLACSIHAGEPTPAATSTPPLIGGSPTPTPEPQTPAEVACEAISTQLIHVYFATVDPETAKAMSRDDLSHWLYAWASYLDKNNEVALARSLSEVARINLSFSRDDNRFRTGTIYSRQMARLCSWIGVPLEESDTSMLVDYLCEGSRLTRQEKLNPSLEYGGSRCWMEVHTHDFYDDRTHGHTELHSHYGYR